MSGGGRKEFNWNRLIFVRNLVYGKQNVRGHSKQLD